MDKCGCEITIKGEKDGPYIELQSMRLTEIHYCPTHKAAFEMKKALNHISAVCHNHKVVPIVYPGPLVIQVVEMCANDAILLAEPTVQRAGLVSEKERQT